MTCETAPSNPTSAEEALRLSEEKFSKVFFATPAILAITTVSDSNFLEVNEYFERSFGYRREEVLGRSALDLNIWANPADRAHVIDTMNRCSRVRDFETRLMHKSGRVLVALYSSEFIDINGEQCLLSLASDITQRKEAEEALRESEERFRCLYNDTPVMLHSIDDTGRLVGVSNYWLEVLGYQLGEVIGRKVTEFFTATSRRYLEEVICPAFSENGFCRDVHCQVVKKNGEVLDVLLAASAVAGRFGKTVHSLAVMTDVTERKRAVKAMRESEERFRMIVETSQEGIVAVDAEARFTYVNRQFEEMLGLKSHEIQGRPYLDFIDESRHDEIRARLERRKDGVPERYDTIFCCRDGSRMWGSVSAISVVGAGGEFIGSFATVVDITRRRQAVEEIEMLNSNLSQRASELQTANEELETFGYTVSHDLRLPLSHIGGYSQIILELFDEELPERCKEYVGEIVKATFRMHHLIDTLLNFSRKTGSEVRRETVAVSAMVQEVMRQFRLTEPQRRVTCTVEQGVTADADPHLLRLVLDNLVGNAWKYTAKKEEALLEFGVTVNAGKEAYFIRDNGVGFDMEQADRLFKPFQRLQGAEFEGAGIGLATVQRIIQRHGGEVWAEGSVGQGATVYFTLG